MEALTYFSNYIIGLGVAIGGIAYMVAKWKQGSSGASENTIRLLNEEIAALRQRLETTTLQITQLNTQSINNTASIANLQKENEELRALIRLALSEYFAAHSTTAQEVKAKLQVK